MATAKVISPLARRPGTKTRVAAYCRVSSSSADQHNSYIRQVDVYTKLIANNPDWELVEIFADEGLSGMKAANREQFQRMIQMCELHQIDMIITKSVSRFARNVKEALEYCRKLKLLGIGVKFEKEGVFTLSMADEMLLNTFAAMAQEESKAISQNQRLSILKRMQSGEYVDSNAPYGYRLVDKQLSVYEPEAQVVRFMYHQYLKGHSTTEIARELNERGIPTKTGKQIWRSSKVSYILRNEKYKGDSKYQKTYRESFVPFRQYKNRGEEDMYYAEQTHPSLIDAETFEAVQKLFAKRQETFGQCSTNITYPLTGRIQCSECGSFFHRRQVSGCVKWACSKHIQDRHLCDSEYYTEERIYTGILTVLNKLRFGGTDVLGQTLKMLESALTFTKQGNMLVQQGDREISELNSKLLMLEKMNAKGYLDGDMVKAQTLEITARLSELKRQRQNAIISRLPAMIADIKHLKSLLWEIEEPLVEFDEGLMHDTVREIAINKHGEMTVTLLGGLSFTEKL